MQNDINPDIYPTAQVLLHGFGPGCIVPDGWHVVSAVNEDGSFHVGGRTAVWPDRIKEMRVGSFHAPGV